MLVVLIATTAAHAATTLMIGGQKATTQIENGIRVGIIQVGKTECPHLQLSNTTVSSAYPGIAFSSSEALPLYITVSGICVIESTGAAGLQTNRRVVVQGSGSLYLKGTNGVTMQTINADSLIVSDGVELICEGTTGMGLLGDGTDLDTKHAKYYNSVSVSGSGTSLIVKGATRAMDIINTLVLNDGAVIHNATTTFSHYLNTTDWVHITATGLPIDATNFPDEAFRNFVNNSTSYNPHSDGFLSRYERSLVKRMDAQVKNIADFKGIEHFANLTYLNISYNNTNSPYSLDLRALTKLDTLECEFSSVKPIVTGLTHLKRLNCCNNDIDELDVSTCQALEYLNCGKNRIASLDLSGLSNLKTFYCYSNNRHPLASLDLSGCTALTTIHCYSGQLTELDVSGCTALTSLWCYENSLTSLNLSANTELKELRCGYMDLGTLDLTNNTKLEELDCYYSHISELKLSTRNANLKNLNCSNNPITTLNMQYIATSSLMTMNCSMCSQLTNLNLSNHTKLTTLNVSSSGLTSLNCNNCLRLDSLNMAGCSAMKSLNIGNCNFSRLGLTGVPALTTLNCQNNKLTTLDVSILPNLTGLTCTQNQLTSLDLSRNPALKSLTCNNNRLTSLDVSACEALVQLVCSGNSMASLDVSGLTNLTHLNCLSCGLTSLNTEGCTALKELQCNQNQLTELNLTGLTALTSLQCYTNQLTSLDLSPCSNLTSVHCSANQLTALDLTSCGHLTTLYLSQNKISGTATDNMIATLPTLSNGEGKLYMINPSHDDEQNECTTLQAKAARRRGWHALIYDKDQGTYGTWVDIPLPDDIPGDADGNGTLTIDDALDVVNYLLGLPTSEDFRLDLADANDDEQVTIADVVTIVNAIK